MNNQNKMNHLAVQNLPRKAPSNINLFYRQGTTLFGFETL